jgi:large subunit ribosomal protein L17
MRHHNANRKFGRKTGQRNALMRSLAESLILKERITTTQAKAKELRPFVEKLVTSGRTSEVNMLSSRRLLTSRVGVQASKKLIDVIAPKYKDRKGGYTRIMKLPARISDGSPMAIIEFV